MSSQKSEVLNVLFHFRNRLDVPSPPSPDGLPALETSSASSFLYASGRPQRSARTAPARLSHTRAASVRSRPHRTHEGTPGRSAARLLPAPDSRAAAPPHPYRNRTAASYSHALSFPFSLPHKPQQHFVTIVAVLPRRDNFPEAGPSIPWLHFTSRGQCLRLHLITRRPAMFMFVALPVLFIFLE